MNDLVPEVLSKSERALQKRIDKLDKAGVTDDRLFKKVLEGLEAGEEEEVLKGGSVSKVVKPNLLIQHKWTETALRMKGHLIPVEISNKVEVNNNTLKMTLSPEDVSRLSIIAATLERMDRSLDSGVGQSGEIIDVKSIVV